MSSSRVLERTDAGVPLLRRGDRLSLAEFERRYRAMPELKKAELIDGTVYLDEHDSDVSHGIAPNMASPVSQVYHGRPRSYLIGLLMRYVFATPGVDCADNATLRLGEEDMPQPDGCLLIEPEFGGQARYDAEGYIVGGPELVAEVTASTAYQDLRVKQSMYRRSGVREYLVWRARDRILDWFMFRGEESVRLSPDADGVIGSTVFPGLRLNPEALFRRDARGMLEPLDQGIASPEHAAFVERLSRFRSGGSQASGPTPGGRR